MDTRRIAELLAPFLADPLDDGQLVRISMYIDLLLRWNARINLTAIRDPEEIVVRHFGESLFAARHLLSPAIGGAAGVLAERTACPEPIRNLPAVPLAPAQSAAETFAGATAPATLSDSDTASSHQQPLRVFDVGSGAGFPGLPLKIFAPDRVRITLIESSHKKAAFLREVIRSLTLTDVDVHHGRAEDLPPASAALVTLRAVERFATILPVVAHLVPPRGRIALLIGTSQLPAVHQLAPWIQWSAPLSLPTSTSRILLIGTK